MKKMSLLAGLMVFSTSAFTAVNNPDFINAQKGEVEVSSQNKNTIAQGFKVALGTANLELDVDLPAGESLNEDIDVSSQVTLGYNKILANQIGFNAELTFLSGEMEGQDSDFKVIEDNLRLSANATYGINDKLYTFAGINSSSYSDKTYSIGTSVVSIEHEAGLGYQLGLGYQATKNIGIEISYITMNSTMEMSGADFYDENDNYIGNSAEYDLTTKGTQINLIGTF